MRVLAYPRWLAAVGPRPVRGRVLVTFRRSAYLVVGSAQAGAVLALVHPTLGRGPLSVVVDGPLPRTGLPVQLAGNRMRIGRRTWELPEDAAWDATLPRKAPPAAAVRACADWLVECGPPHSLAPVLAHLLRASGPQLAPWQARALEGARALCVGAHARAAGLLCGLGIGLTPSGDDFLCGWMLAAHVRGAPAAPLLAHATSTHRISRAYLRAAACGQAPESWHRLLAAFHAGGWEVEAQAVCSAGATSGTDTLAGFLAGLLCRP